MARLIKDVCYPASLDHARALLESVFGAAEGIWRAPNGDRLGFYEVGRRKMHIQDGIGMAEAEADIVSPPRLPTRATWVLYRLKPNGHQSGEGASIEAYEQRPDETVLRFLDGRRSSDPIGEAFEQLVETVAGEMRTQTGVKETTPGRLRMEQSAGETNTPAEPGTQPTRRGPTGAHGNTLTRVKDARRLIEQKVPKTKACRRAHVDPRTYDRYIGDVLDWEDDYLKLDLT